MGRITENPLCKEGFKDKGISLIAVAQGTKNNTKNKMKEKNETL
jgi:hypothetical protein